MFKVKATELCPLQVQNLFIIKSTIISENNLNFYMTAAAELLEDHDSVTVVAAAIKMMTKEPDATPVRLTDEAPMISKRNRNNRSSSKRRDGGGGGGYRGKGRSSYGDKKRSSNDRNRSSNDRRQKKSYNN
ncbi:DEAD/DEAH box helicase [Bacillus safensis FO-36b] [Bacillus safensis subsp. safensis]